MTSDMRDMSGIWVGEYQYPEPYSPPVPFFATISEVGGVLSDTTSEQSDLLEGANEEANIRGTRNGSSVQFYKYYDGDGAYGHSVEYSGEITDDGQTVTGQWAIDDYCGKFSIWRELFDADELGLFEEADLVL